jgi:hypothetical protein
MSSEEDWLYSRNTHTPSSAPIMTWSREEEALLMEVYAQYIHPGPGGLRSWSEVAELMNQNVIARAEVLARRMRPRYNAFMVNSYYRIHRNHLIERFGTDGRIAAGYAGQSDAEATQILMSMLRGPTQEGAAAGSVASESAVAERSGGAVANDSGTQNPVEQAVAAGREVPITRTNYRSVGVQTRTYRSVGT